MLLPLTQSTRARGMCFACLHACSFQIRSSNSNSLVTSLSVAFMLVAGWLDGRRRYNTKAAKAKKASAVLEHLANATRRILQRDQFRGSTHAHARAAAAAITSGPSSQGLAAEPTKNYLLFQATSSSTSKQTSAAATRPASCQHLHYSPDHLRELQCISNELVRRECEREGRKTSQGRGGEEDLEYYVSASQGCRTLKNIYVRRLKYVN